MKGRAVRSRRRIGRVWPRAGFLVLLGLALALGLTLAAPAGPATQAAAVTTVFKQIRTPCKTPKTQVGLACLDMSGAYYPEKWTVGESSAKWSPPDLNGTFTYTVPKTVSGSGATLSLRAVIDGKPGLDIRFCVTSSFAIKVSGEPCATATVPAAGGSGSDSQTLTLLGGGAAAGATATVDIGWQDGPHLLFTYKAENATPKCKKPARVGLAADECGEVTFAFQQGGLPKGAVARPYLDMTTNGIGSVTFDARDRVETVSGRVVRTIDYIDLKSPEKVRKEATIRFRFLNSGEAFYIPKPERQLKLPVAVLSSNDPTCTGIKGGLLVLQDGRGAAPDSIRLYIPGCPGHSLVLVDKSAQGKRPLVRVAISVK